MSKAKPMPLMRRIAGYVGRPDADESIIRAQYSERDLTPAQRRRAWHKAHRSGERANPNETLYGRKGRPTPRQRKPVRRG